jgi:hypothetical protein
MNITVFIGWNRHHVTSDDVCLSMGVLSHYAVISSLFWAVVLGKCVHTTVHQNIYRWNKAFMLKACIFAYGRFNIKIYNGHLILVSM